MQYTNTFHTLLTFTLSLAYTLSLSFSFSVIFMVSEPTKIQPWLPYQTVQQPALTLTLPLSLQLKLQ
jgi:hypothetical protein